MGKGQPTGDGTRLESGRDHPSGGARALRVRLPPEPSITPSWSSLECSPRCQRGATLQAGFPPGFKSRRGR